MWHLKKGYLNNEGDNSKYTGYFFEKRKVASYGAKILGLLELSGNDLCLVNRIRNLMFNST